MYEDERVTKGLFGGGGGTRQHDGGQQVLLVWAGLQTVYAFEATGMTSRPSNWPHQTSHTMNTALW